MALLGVVISTLSTAAMAFVSTPFWFNILGTLRGIGSGVIGIVSFIGYIYDFTQPCTLANWLTILFIVISIVLLGLSFKKLLRT